MRSRSLKARVLLPEVKSPVLGRPSTPPRHQYKPHTLSLWLHSHEAVAFPCGKRPHRGPSQWLAVVCEMSMLSSQTGSGMLAVLLILPWTT